VRRAYVGIGSNVERHANIRSAVQALTRRYGPLTLSSVYESAPVGFTGKNFFNLVAGFDTDLPVERLIGELHDIEQAHGRARSGQRFEPRTLDLDLLLYGDLVRHDAIVDVPRREILEYAFVLQPLAEIAPERIHPETNQSIATLWDEHRQRMTPLAKAGFDPLQH
jgi:2-amino-4-hydroxy-6-hydroxymethyldihydropteridine diphosphokinase